MLKTCGRLSDGRYAAPQFGEDFQTLSESFVSKKKALLVRHAKLTNEAVIRTVRTSALISCSDPASTPIFQLEEIIP